MSSTAHPIFLTSNLTQILIILKGLKSMNQNSAFKSYADEMAVSIAKTHIFIELYPIDCNEFTKLFSESLSYCEQLIITNSTKGDWGEDYSLKLNCMLQAANPKNYMKLSILKSKKHVYLFVYGTLMKPNRKNKTLLEDENYIGKCTLKGYDLYDLDYFPGIVEGTDMVKGELYSVSVDKLTDIDRFEGKSVLYKRSMVQVHSDCDDKYNAFTYVYNKPIKGRIKINYENQPWHEEITKTDIDSDLVWYACYGSNISKERFMQYIDGNKFSNRAICRKGCSDKTPPRIEKPYIFNNSIYFSNKSSTWENKGVAFLDISKNGLSYGKMYLITNKQFEEIKVQEGDSYNWYGKTVELGYMDGIAVKTITKAEYTNDVIPSSKYLDVIKKGIHETYPEMTSSDIDAYLMKCYLSKEHISILKYLRKQIHGVSNKYISNDLDLEISSVLNIINDLKNVGLIKQDGRSIRAGVSWAEGEAIYYTFSEKREAIDKL